MKGIGYSFLYLVSFIQDFNVFIYLLVCGIFFSIYVYKMLKMFEMSSSKQHCHHCYLSEVPVQFVLETCVLFPFCLGFLDELWTGTIGSSKMVLSNIHTFKRIEITDVPIMYHLYNYKYNC